jgi:hypothetical protein
MRNDIPQTVENVFYPKLKAVAAAYGLGERRIYKRYQRGKRNDDLIPAKYRRDYIPPIPKPKKLSRVSREFTAGGVKYKNAADACRQLKIDYNTYKSRISRKWTKEEALQIVPRIDKRTIKHSSKKRNRLNSRKPLIAFGKKYKSYTELEKQFGIKSYVLRQRVNNGKSLEEAILMEGKGKKIKIGNVEFKSMAAFSKSIGIEPHSFYQLHKKYSVDQIIGIENRKTANSIVYRGNWYPSQIALAKDFGLTANEYYYRIHICRLSMDEALSIPPNSSVVESVFGNEGKLYIAEIVNSSENTNDEAKLYKIGVTRHRLDKRYAGFPFQCVTVLCKKGNIGYLKEVEKKIKDVYKDKKYTNFTAKDFDGFSEVYQLTKTEINKLKLIVEFDMFDLNLKVEENNISLS